MNSGKMCFYNNRWEILESTKEALDQIIDNEGNKIIDSQSDIKKIEKNVKLKDLFDIEKYLSFIFNFLKNIESDPFVAIPFLTYKEINRIQNDISGIIVKIRSISTLYKYPDFLNKFNEKLNEIRIDIEKIDALILEKFQFLQEISSNSTTLEEFAQKHQQILDEKSIWYHMELIKETDYRYDPYSFHNFQFIEEFDQLEDIIKSYVKETKTNYISIEKIISIFTKLDHKTLSNIDFLKEFIHYVLIQNGLKPDYANTYKNPNRKNDITKSLEKYCDNLINNKMSQLTNDLVIPYEWNDQTIPTNNIPRIITTNLSSFQEKITAEKSGDLYVINKEFQNYGAKFFKILEKLEFYTNSLNYFLYPWKTIFKKISQMIKQLRGEIERILEDFDQYASSVQENNFKIDLEQKINRKKNLLNKILDEYNSQIQPFIETIPQLENMMPIIHDFETKIINLNDETHNLFKEFQEKKLNIAPFIEQWEEKYEEIVNRSKFTIKETLSSIFNQFSSLLEKEQIMKDALSNLGPQSIENNQDAIQFITPVNYSEQDLKIRIERLNNKIEQVDQRKEKYLKEKEYFIRRLEEKLKDKGLETKKCIICHRPVTGAEDHFIKCEFCDSLSHYSCAVWWIEKYNSCPVCSNKYTIPSNGLYDPDQLEQ